MKHRSVFITVEEWFESTSLKNPIICLDHKLKQGFPEYYAVNYDTKLLSTTTATAEEKQAPFYNDYRERYGNEDIHSLDEAIMNKDKRYVFLNGFDQDQFMYIAPKLKDTAEILYFFKCPKIYDLSILSRFSKLRCVHIYWNNSLENLWDMTGNTELKILSCVMISKLNSVEALKTSCVEYVCLDSSDNSGQKKKILFDTSAFTQMKTLKHLTLGYSDCNIDY